MRLRRSRSFKVTDFGTNRKLICDFLVVINSNLPPILHRFRYSLAKVQNRYIWLFLFGLTSPPRRRGSPGTISVKFYLDVSGQARFQRRRKIVENSNRLSRVHERYRQTTDDRRQTDRRQTTDRQTTDGRMTTYSERSKLIETFLKKLRRVVGELNV